MCISQVEKATFYPLPRVDAHHTYAPPLRQRLTPSNFRNSRSQTNHLAIAGNLFGPGEIDLTRVLFNLSAIRLCGTMTTFSI